VKWEDGDQRKEVLVVRATPNLAGTLHLRPALGRLFPPSGVPSAEPAAPISHELRQSRFGGNPVVVGQKVRVDKELQTIVGVLSSRPRPTVCLRGNSSALRRMTQCCWRVPVFSCCASPCAPAGSPPVGPRKRIR
ncbi:MAG TPA: ABC transporter permease, partial [Verrucomicrobiae bacterium]|nr:ABC transporter permease [Verrucomicrobiae bacterium]